jgi:energy-coupling factor transporter ATP-binding protein EcfA2
MRRCMTGLGAGLIDERAASVLPVEHDMHFLLPLAQRIVLMNFGRKIAAARRGCQVVVSAPSGIATEPTFDLKLRPHTCVSLSHDTRGGRADDAGRYQPLLRRRAGI